jgi:uncharacterized protein YjbI with pentapeptide repeats
MTQSFANQDLRNRSFRGQDLTGADFIGQDIRGCDFRDAILIDANFTAVKTGKSRKQLIILIAFAGAGAVVITLAVAFAFTVTFAFAVAVAVTMAVAGAFVFAGTVVFAFAGAGTVAVAVIGQAYTEFVAGKTSLGILYTISSIILIALTFHYGRKLIKTFQQAKGTDYRGANLTGAQFINADLRVTDFTNAICNLVNWKGAKFYRCNLPKVLEDDSVRDLCRNPKGGRAQDYIGKDLRQVYLQEADLVDAKLQNANLNGADLRGAKLTNANLSNSQALGTNFAGATLTGAIIVNWGINPDTNFENVICCYIYIDEAQKERKPSSGEFSKGDFAKLVTKFTKTLDFLFKNGIQPQAFDQALQEMLDRYGEMGIQMQSVDSIGNGDRLVRFEVQDPNADKGKIHADFERDYNGAVRQLEAAQNEIKQFRQANTELATQLAVSETRNEEKEKHSAFLRDFVYHQTNRFSRPQFNAPHSTFSGDPMSDKNQNIQLQSGGDMTGVTVAGGDISGTVTLTIQQLRDSSIPEAPKLADLLTQLQAAITDSSELEVEDKKKALNYLDRIGKLANDKDSDRSIISMAIDGIIGIVSKAAKLLTPVGAIAASLRKLLQL